jgi:hypothetical protein
MEAKPQTPLAPITEFRLEDFIEKYRRVMILWLRIDTQEGVGAVLPKPMEPIQLSLVVVRFVWSEIQRPTADCRLRHALDR